MVGGVLVPRMTFYRKGRRGCATGAGRRQGKSAMRSSAQRSRSTRPSLTDGLSILYQDLLSGSYDCVDRIVLNGYFRIGA